MRRMKALSNIGYVIVLVIVLGFVMIVTAPMFINKTKKQPTQNEQKQEYSNNVDNSYLQENIDNIYAQIENLENKLTNRISKLEASQENSKDNFSEEASNSNNFSCTIDGVANENGDVTPIDSLNSEDLKGKKIVFVCEYKD